jgi:nicotinamidase-related amidase
MAHRFGFFDVDSRELDESRRALGYRPRVLPIVPKLERLYALADAKGWPLVFTTCCSGRMLPPEALPDTLFVPLDASDAAWRAKVGDYRRFYLAKRTCGDPKLNFNTRTFDMFQHNANARLLLQSLDVETWVVFGNGFDLCVGSAANGILGAGLPLLLIEDVRVSSADGTPASEAETLRRLRERGARTMTLEAFLKEEAT